MSIRETAFEYDYVKTGDLGMTVKDRRSTAKRFARLSPTFSLLAFLMAMFCAVTPVHALENPVIDAFVVDTEPNPLGDGEGGSAFDRNILGGFRDVAISGDVTGEGNEEFFIFDGSSDSEGTAALAWDGEDEDPFLLTPDGLGGVDFTIDDEQFEDRDALLLHFNSIGAPGTVKVEVYNDESTGSSFTASLPVSAVPFDLVIPFASFSVLLDDPADFASVGALLVELGGGLVAELDQIQIASVLAGVTKTDALQNDVNDNDLVDPGDTLRYTISVPVSADVELTFTDTPDENTTLVTGSVTTTHGTVTTGQSQGDTSVEVALGTVPAGATATVTFDVVVDDTGAELVCNQGTVAGTGINEAYTDDPDVANESADPTCTDIFIDNTPPTFDSFPPDTSVNLGEDTSPENTGGYPTASDNVTADPVIAYADTVIKGPLPFETEIRRTWTATDEAQNSTDQVQTITILDTQDRSLYIEQPTYGLFQPSSDPGNRQLGQISLEGDIALLGTATSIYDDDISTPSGITAYSIGGDVVYFIGKTQSDGISRIFTVDTADGSATSQELGFGTDSTVVGIWYDDSNETLYGLFQTGTSLDDRRLAVIDPSDGTVSFLAGTISAPIYTVGGIAAGSGSLGKFYFLGSTGGIPGSIYSVDTSTGAATSAALSGVNYNAVASLEFDQLEGELYALVFEGAERRLATIDPDTGAATSIGDTTVAGGGVHIATYTGVATLDPTGNQFLFVGRYNGGSGNVWALFAVDTETGDTTYSDIDVTDIDSGNYYGLEYAVSTGKIEVVKNLAPDYDPGLFNLQIDGDTEGTGADVSHGGTTGEITVDSGDHQVGEAAGTDTDLADYDTTIECRDDDGAGSVVASGANPVTVTVNEDDDIVCVITNTDKDLADVDLTVAKSVTEPAGDPAVGDDWTWRLAITNNGPDQATIPHPSTVLTDTFPVGPTYADPGAVALGSGSMDCTFSGDNGNVLTCATVSGAEDRTIDAGATVNVDVIASSTEQGVFDNAADDCFVDQTDSVWESDETNNNCESDSSVTVVLADPAFEKAFDPSTVNVGGTSTLTFTIANINNEPLTGLNFTDTYPSGMVNTDSLNVGGTCGAIAHDATAGGSTFNLTSATIGADTSCTVTVDVAASSAGSKTNTAENIGSTETGPGDDDASATLTVYVLPAFEKAFDPATINVGDTSTLTYTITNSNSVGLNGLNFTDSYPTGMVNTNPLNVGGTCGAIAHDATAGGSTFNLTSATIGADTSCTVTVDVTASSAGSKTNTAENIGSTETGSGDDDASATLTVYALPTFEKAFDPATINVGDTSTLTYTITNSNSVGLNGLNFTDSYPSGMLNTDPLNVSSDCGTITYDATEGGSRFDLTGGSVGANASCTVSVDVTSTTLGVNANTAENIGSAETGPGDDDASADLLVTAPDLVAEKSNDVDGSTQLGYAWTWQIVVENTGDASAVFDDGETVFIDEMPASGMSYEGANVSIESGVAGNLSCALGGDSDNVIQCVADGGQVQIDSGGKFTVTTTATPSTAETKNNPDGGVCEVDPDTIIVESDETNNSCSDPVFVGEAPDDYYVEPLGYCGGNTPCFSTIQDAIDAAFGSPTIHVAEGDYPENVVHDANALLEFGWDPDFTSQSPSTAANLLGPGSAF